MSTKENIIRLGRSKSHNKRNQSNTSSEYTPNSTIHSFHSQQIEETSIINRSLHLEPQTSHGSRQKICITHKNLTNSHGPSPHRLVTKQKMESPQKNVFIKKSPVISNQSPKTKDKENINNESHFIRKIKMLEQRVQELHHEKQMCFVRTYEESKKIKEDYKYLETQLKLIEKEKIMLKEEIKNLQNKIIKQKESLNLYEQNKIINNYIYTQPENIFINHEEKEKQFESLKETNKELYNQITMLEQLNQEFKEENQKLKVELIEMKEIIISTTAIIEENNQNIIENYEHKITIFQNEIQEFKNKVNNQSILEECLDNNRKEISDFIKKLIEKDNELSQKTKELFDKESECEMYRKSWEESKIEVGEYSEKLLKKNEEMTLLEEEFITRINEISNNSQLNEEKASGALNRIKSLEEQLEKFSEISPDKAEKSKIQEPCKRCQELIKTLAKLNQKAFSQTS